MTAALDLRGLSAAYRGKALALTGVDLAVAAGEIVALLGANGAGKTTLIRAVSGLLGLHGGAIAGGTVQVAGRPVARLSADRIVRLGVGQVPEGRLVFKNLTVAENLAVGAAVLPRAAGLERNAFQSACSCTSSENQ